MFFWKKSFFLAKRPGRTGGEEVKGKRRKKNFTSFATEVFSTD
jgi:hypothetical protein